MHACKKDTTLYAPPANKFTATRVSKIITDFFNSPNTLNLRSNAAINLKLLRLSFKEFVFGVGNF